MTNSGASLSEEHLEQQNKRKADREKYEREAFAYYYKEMYLIAQWVKVDDLTKSVKDQLKTNDPDQPRFESPTSQLGLLKDGVYRSPNHPGLDLVLEDGKVTWLKKPKTDAEFNAYVSATMDFLAVARGTKSITIDWPKAKNVSEKRLMEIMDMAEKKGLKVEFGPRVQEYLRSKRDEKHWWQHKGGIKTAIKQALKSHVDTEGGDKYLTDEQAQARRDRIFNRQRELRVKAMQVTQTSDYKKYEAEYQSQITDIQFQKQAASLIGTDKLQGNSLAEKRKDYESKVFGKNYDSLSEEEQITALKKDIKTLADGRTATLMDIATKLDSHIDDRIEQLKNPSTDLVAQVKVGDSTRTNLVTQMQNELQDLRNRQGESINRLKELAKPLKNGSEEQQKEATKIENLIKKQEKALDQTKKTIQGIGLKMTDALPKALKEADTKLSSSAPQKKS